MSHVNNIVFCTQSDAMVLAIGKRTRLRLKRKRSGFRWGHGVLNQRRPTEKRLNGQKAVPKETFGETGDIAPTPIRSTHHLERTECLKISNDAVNRQSYLPITSPKKFCSCINYTMITEINNFMSPVFLLTLRSINDLLIQPLHDPGCFRRNLEIVEAILNYSGTGRGFSDTNFVRMARASWMCCSWHCLVSLTFLLCFRLASTLQPEQLQKIRMA